MMASTRKTRIYGLYTHYYSRFNMKPNIYDYIK
jgi:hypothetical protein